MRGTSIYAHVTCASPHEFVIRLEKGTRATHHNLRECRFKDLIGKIERVFAWDEFRDLLKRFHPSQIYYAQAKSPLSRPPVALRLTFPYEGVQYVFVDTAAGDHLRRTGIPIRKDKVGNFSIEEEDLKNFIFTELKRVDLKVRSFELMGGY